MVSQLFFHHRFYNLDSDCLQYLPNTVLITLYCCGCSSCLHLLHNKVTVYARSPISCATLEAKRQLFLHHRDFHACNTGLITTVNIAWAVTAASGERNGSGEHEGDVFN